QPEIAILFSLAILQWNENISSEAVLKLLSWIAWRAFFLSPLPSVKIPKALLRIADKPSSFSATISLQVGIPK
ncbi:16750_t:CDS:2, partial [Dentiscutata heterogama]